MNSRGFLNVIIWKRFVLLTALALTMASALFSQTTQRANRITQDVNSGPMVTVSGNVHPLTRMATDVGASSSGMQMNSLTLNIGLSAAQQKELDALLAAQQTPGSALYHQWLTQEEYGARFGLTDADLQKVTGWLTGQGFKVQNVASSRNAIYFSGKAGQVESAFHTKLHQYRLNGETHFANATQLQVPAGIAGVLQNVRGLNNFRLKPNVHKATPEYTYNASTHFLTPGDWAIIYDVTSIYNAGYDGTGTHVGVVGQTYAPQTDINNFRSASGLSATKLTYVCIDTVAANCTGAASISTEGDLGEADLDIEWSGGVAKNATVHFVYAPYSDVNLSVSALNVLDALQYAVESYKVPGTGGAVLPVLSMSYSDCEYNLYDSPGVVDSSYYNWIVGVGQQANLQGQTIVVASGDSGAAGCDQQGIPANDPAKGGAWVNVPDDSPNYTSVGGTTLDATSSTYWNETTNQVVTALSYIPEIVWNDTSSSYGLLASGGGVSTVFPQPSWQQIPNGFSGTPGRFVPDVAFAASPAINAYMYCSEENNSPTYGTMCAKGFYSSGTGEDSVFYITGGTSAATPSFAGMLTLLTQKYGAQGNINPTLYNLALNTASYATVFHDITNGYNEVPCVAGTSGCLVSTVGDNYMGWLATPGYDLATGLGSIDGGALYTALGTPALPATTISVTETSSSVMIGHTASFTATVSSASSGSIAGAITFSVGGTTLGTVSITGGTATLSNVTVSTANGFSVGSDTVTAVFGGDTDFAASVGSAILTVLPLQATTTTLTATPNALMAGGTTTLTATVASAGAGTITGTVTFTANYTTLGTVSVSGGVATLSNLTANLGQFVSGANTVTATYSGDVNFAVSNGSTSVTVTPIATSTTVTVSPSSIMLNGGTINLSVTVSSAGSAPNGYGQVYFQVGSQQFSGVAVPSSGTATVSNISVNTQNGFVAGIDTITASYYAGWNFAASSGTTTLTVTPQPATTTTVTASPSSVTIGGTTTLTASVVSKTSGTPTGTVNFGAVGSAPLLSNGTATLANVTVSAANGFTKGTATIPAKYSGDANFAGSSGSTTMTVTALPSTMTVTLTPTTVTAGGTTTVTAVVSGSGGITPTNGVSFILGSMVIGGNALSGSSVTSSIPVTSSSGFVAGSNTITASYGGDGNYSPSSATATVTMVPTYSLSALNPAAMSPGSSIPVPITVTSNGYAGTVSFVAVSSGSGVSASAAPVTINSNGTATATLTIKASSSAANHVPVRPWKSGGTLVFCAVLLGVPFTVRRKWALAVLLMAGAIVAAGFLVSCSGGGGSSAPAGPQYFNVTVTPTGTGTVTNSPGVIVSVTVQ